MVGDYRDLLRKELDGRKAKNSAYSLRAFARDLGLLPAALSEILLGRRGLSRQSAQRVGKCLGLQGEKLADFLDQVQAVSGRSARERAQAQARLARPRESSFSEVSIDRARVFLEWEHLALREAVTNPTFVWDAKLWGKRFGIGEARAQECWDRLRRHEIVQWSANGRWEHDGPLTIPDSMPVEGLRRLHRALVKKAAESLEDIPLSHRSHTGAVFSLRVEDIEDARVMLRDFRRSFTLRFQANPDARLAKPKESKVYGFCLQLFPLEVDESMNTIDKGEMPKENPA